MDLIDLISDAALTAYPHPTLPPQHSDEEKIALIEWHFRQIMETLELDLADPSLTHTPRRVAEMYVKEFFCGLKSNQFPKITYLDNNFIHEQEGIVLVKEIAVKSICEHHFVPIIGTARVAYLPRNKILGLSKINRIVEYFCKRPQIQERLNAQIADSLSTLLETPDVAVAIEAEHFCVTMRGVQDADSKTYTHVLKGRFQTDPSIKQDFFR